MFGAIPIMHHFFFTEYKYQLSDEYTREKCHKNHKAQKKKKQQTIHQRRTLDKAIETNDPYARLFRNI